MHLLELEYVGRHPSRRQLVVVVRGEGEVLIGLGALVDALADDLLSR